MKLRLPGRRTDANPAPDSSAELTAQSVRMAGKGRPTPKRSEAQGRRQGPPPPPPTTRKEAYRRMRANQAAGRTNTRLAALGGDDSALPARDRGPERKLVRDVVDSRRNVGSVFLPIAVLLLVAQFTPNLALKSYAFIAFTLFFLLLIIDSFLLGRRVKKAVGERYPDTKLRQRSLVWYAISRSTMIRRWRFPKPDVAASTTRA